jgi:DNA polymerase-3 subunit chi
MSDEIKEVNFYQIEEAEFGKVFPKLIETIVGSGNRVLIYDKDEKRISDIDNLLWTYAQLAFIPHATYRDGIKEENAVYITNNIKDNPNCSSFAVLMSNFDEHEQHGFSKYFYFLDEKSDLDINSTSKELSAKGFNCFIIKKEAGKWAKDAVKLI